MRRLVRIKNYSKSNKNVIRIEQIDNLDHQQRAQQKQSSMHAVDDGLWLGGINTGIPNGYYKKGFKEQIKDGLWSENKFIGNPDGFYSRGHVLDDYFQNVDNLQSSNYCINPFKIDQLELEFKFDNIEY
jgi:hypothetical protein